MDLATPLIRWPRSITTTKKLHIFCCNFDFGLKRNLLNGKPTNECLLETQIDFFFINFSTLLYYY